MRTQGDNHISDSGSMLGGCGYSSGHVRMVSEPRPATFESAADWYDYTTADHFWMRWRFSAVLALLRDENVPIDMPLRALDVGAGCGIFREQVEESTQWAVDCTDLNLSALRRNRAGRGSVMYYDICDKRTEFRQTYDIAMCLDVLEHIQDTETFLQSVIFHVKPGGHVLINVPALQTLYGHYDSVAGHLRRYNRQLLSAAFRNMDVEGIVCRYWGLLLVPVVLLRKVMLRRVPSAKETLRLGFSASGAFADCALSALMGLELRLIRRPLVGSSLMLLARVRDA